MCYNDAKGCAISTSNKGGTSMVKTGNIDFLYIFYFNFLMFVYWININNASKEK